MVTISEQVQGLVKSYSERLGACPFCKQRPHFELSVTEGVPEVASLPQKDWVIPSDEPRIRLEIAHPGSYIYGKCFTAVYHVDPKLVNDITYMIYLVQRCVSEWNLRLPRD